MHHLSKRSRTKSGRLQDENCDTEELREGGGPTLIGLKMSVRWDAARWPDLSHLVNLVMFLVPLEGALHVRGVQPQWYHIINPGGNGKICWTGVRSGGETTPNKNSPPMIQKP